MLSILFIKKSLNCSQLIWICSAASREVNDRVYGAKQDPGVMTALSDDIWEVFCFGIFNRGLVLNEKLLIDVIGDMQSILYPFMLCFPAIPSFRACGFIQPGVCFCLFLKGAIESRIDRQDLWKRSISSFVFKQVEEESITGIVESTL